MPRIVFDGTTGRVEHDVGTVEIDGLSLTPGEPVDVTDEQLERLEDSLPGHRFSPAEGDGLDKLKVEQLDSLAVENGVDLSGAQNKADKVDALREAGVTPGGS